MGAIFHQLLYIPLFNLLIGIYNTLPGADFGAAIIVLTLLIRIVFVPLSIKATRSQQAMARVQSKVKDLQERHKNDREGLAKATMALYKEHNVNPFGGCLPILIQIPVILALYQVFRDGFTGNDLAELYSFVSRPEHINTISFGFLDLAQNYPVMAILAGALQFVQAWLAMRAQQTPIDPKSPAAAMTKQMMYVFPVMIIFISWSLPAGIVLYWITTTTFAIFEQLYIKKRYTPAGGPKQIVQIVK